MLVEDLTNKLVAEVRKSKTYKEELEFTKMASINIIVLSLIMLTCRPSLLLALNA